VLGNPPDDLTEGMNLTKVIEPVEAELAINHRLVYLWRVILRLLGNESGNCRTSII